MPLHCVSYYIAMDVIWLVCQAHQERWMVNSGQFEETIHKRYEVDLTPSTFPHSQYQLPITKVIKVELPYTSSITEAGVSRWWIINDRWQVSAGTQFSLLLCQTATRFNNWCGHTHECTRVFTLYAAKCKHSHKNNHNTQILLCTPHPHLDRSRQKKPANKYKTSNTPTNTHFLTHRLCTG